MIRFLDIKKITDSFQPGLGDVVRQVVDSGVYIRGGHVEQFEQAYASFTGCQHCVGVGNGFDALRLIFKSWILSGDLQEGDEVIVPANTYIASILSVTENRLIPVWVEPDIHTFNIDPARLEEKITRRTRAILLVHLYGRNAMHDRIHELAERYRLKIVEDNAQAAGCYWKTKRTGSLADAAAHSFFPTKNLGALGDGGAVSTDDTLLAENIRTLANYGSHKKGVNNIQGINSRLDELQAAVLNLKLRRLDQDNELRRNISRHYLDRIVNPLIILPAMPSPEQMKEHVWHLFVLRCEKRNELQEFLVRNGIETLVHYPIPPHRQNAFKEMNGFTFPITEQIHREVLSLPLNPVLERAEISKVVDAVNAFR